MCWEVAACTVTGSVTTRTRVRGQPFGPAAGDFFPLIWINYYEFIEYRHSYSVIYAPYELITIG